MCIFCTFLFLQLEPEKNLYALLGYRTLLQIYITPSAVVAKKAITVLQSISPTPFSNYPEIPDGLYLVFCGYLLVSD